jgi:hypothetical protein
MDMRPATNRLVLTRKTAGNVLLCGLMLFAMACPVLCIAQVSAAPAHACCPGGKQAPQPAGHMLSRCDLVAPADADQLIHAPSGGFLPQQPAVTVPVLPAAVTLPPAPRPINPSPQKLLFVLRI